MTKQNGFSKRMLSTGRVTSGLTVVEVLFAMVIVLVGLVGVAFMVPFAIRQAEDSYKITQGLAAGDNALGVFNSHSIVQPRMDAPWLFIGDDGTRAVATSMSEYYASEFNVRILANSPTTLLQYAQLQNETIGMGFCIDPMFWGAQNSTAGLNNFTKTRFPFYNENMPTDYDPFGDATMTYITTPRLRRVSLFDPNSDPSNPFWLRQPPANSLAAVSGGDLTQSVRAADNRNGAPLRAEYADGAGALLVSPTSGASVSWLACLTPSDSTPLIGSSMLSVATQGTLRLLPESYDLAVVVFSKRDVRDFNLNATTGIGATGVVPTSERLGFLIDSSAATPDAWNAGTFDITILADSKVEGRVKIGDWLMLSRNSSVEFDTGSFATRQRHKWYRVISVTGENVFPKTVRVSGEPWYWTEHEIKYYNRMNITPPALPPTAVTLLKDVIQVYQRSVSLQTN